MTKKEKKVSIKSLEEILEKIKELRDERRGQGKRPCTERKLDILYITGCTEKKNEKDGELEAYRRYEGPASKKMLNLFGNNREKQILDLYVMSAGYGFIPADSKISFYDITFAGKRKSLIKCMAEKLELMEDFKKLINSKYKLIVLRIGSGYIKALKYVAPEGGYKLPEETVVCYLRAPSSNEKIQLSGGNVKIIDIPKTVKINVSFQDCFWHKFFEKHINDSTDRIINKIIKSKSLEDLLQ